MLVLRWRKSLATRAEPVGIANFRLQVTSDNVQKRPRQQHTARWSDQCSTTHPLYRIHINKEEQVQRRAARYVYNDYVTRTPGCVTAMVRDIGWECLQDRRSMARLSLLYKMQHGLADVDTSSPLPQ